MADFNSDNAKIDAALTEQAAVLGTKASKNELAASQKWVKIGEATLSTASKTLEFTVTNAEQYHHLVMVGTASGGRCAYCTLNGALLMGCYSFTTGYYEAASLVGRSEFYSCNGEYIFGISDWAAVSTTGDTKQEHSSGSSATALSGSVTIGLMEYGVGLNLAAGSYIEVYGLKK